ncbi:hypothetical protein OG756_34255 [Streptomyces sp. NBC_01310]|uniref:hypothetical protein n=1 Tax=Streptomyces sp. NBC_01310 TaxID=2903820 RepID=UPI0035B6373F|nr:hypothetical protein OG756_34255 [Streptomyces sp. NBC_01310]
MATARRWHLMGSPGFEYSGEEARQLLRHRLDWGTLETWFEDGQAAQLGVVTNGERAMVSFMDLESGRGEHLVDLRASGTSGSYQLASGKVDVRADRDTVTFEDAGRAVAYFIEHARWPDDVSVEDDHRSSARAPR